MLITTTKMGRALARRAQGLLGRLLLERLEDRLVLSVAEGTVLAATLPSTFAGKDVSGFPTAIVGVDPGTGTQSLISSGNLFALPTYIAEGPNQQLYVTDLKASGTGAVLAVDPDTGTQRVVATGGFINGPNVLVYWNGFLYVANEGDASGAIHNLVRVDPNTGEQKLISDGSAGGFSVPVGMALAGGNNVYVADEPGNVRGSDPGKIWRVNLDTGQQTIVSDNNSSQGKFFNHPVDIAIDGNGNIVVVNTGSVSNGYAGSVFRINAQTGVQSLVSTFGSDTGLDSIEVGQDGTLLIGAIQVGTIPGRIYSVNPVSGAQGIIASGGSLSEVEGIRAFHVTSTASSHTTLITSANPAVSGQAVTLTATVTGNGTRNPTGVVNFFDGSAFLGQGSLSTTAGGTTATLSTATLSTTTHTILAIYTGDGSFRPSTSTALPLTINKGSTSLSITTSSNPSALGQNVAFTATVLITAPAAGTPTGTVQFQIDGSNVGGAVNVSSSGTAIFSTTALPVGPHTITAKYSGDGNFAGSNGALSGVQTIASLGTTTTVASSANPSLSGQAVTFTATVGVLSPGSGTPKGTVQFLIDGNPVGSPVTLSGGQATSDPITWLTAGGHKITASYSGSPDFAASVGSLTGGQNVQNGTNVPTVTCSVAQSQLWPANKKMVNVGLSVTVAPASASIDVQVYGNDDADESDVDNIAPGSLELRAVREDDEGRVYLIVVTASKGDATSFDVCAVVVPGDNSDDSIQAVQQDAAAAVAYYRKFQTAPDDFDLLGDSGGDGDAPPPSANPRKPNAPASVLSSALTELQVPAASPGPLTSPNTAPGSAVTPSPSLQGTIPFVDQFFASVKKQESTPIQSGRTPMAAGEVGLELFHTGVL
ncbi:MAG TPA: Ig-like domain repeat protein [Gemmataceae bacterium]|nr:Ig-like domain repeat protein [Gemmataceae bacterium]